MDAVDASILRKLSWHPLNPVDRERGTLGVWDVARALKVHGNTVKRRLEALEAAGILCGMRMFPDASLARMEVAHYGFVYPDDESCRQAEATARAGNPPGVTCRLDGYELRTNLGIPAGGDLDAVARAFHEKTGAVSHHVVTPRTWGAEDPTGLERRLMFILLRDAFLRPTEIAEELGVTPRTVRTRMASLIAKGAITVVPFISYMDITEAFPFMLDVDTGQDAKVSERVLRKHPELLLNSTTSAPVLWLMGIGTSPRDAAAAADAIRVIEGVRTVRPRLILSWSWVSLPDAGTSVSRGLALLEPDLTVSPDEWVGITD